MERDIPEQLDLILTDMSNLYRSTDGNNIFICLNQHNASSLIFEDTKIALKNYLGQNVHMEGQIFTAIFDSCFIYFRDWYNRFLKGKEPLTKQQIGKKIGQIVLQKLQAPLRESNMEVKHLSALDKLLKQDNIVVLNHKKDSNAALHILLHYLKKFDIDLDQDNTTLMDELIEKWLENKLHLPIVSKDHNMDFLILRALELANFTVKVLILRYKMFTITEDQTVYTILQNLEKSGEFTLQSGENVESFVYASTSLDFVRSNLEKLHHDSFAKTMLKYSSACDDVFFPKSFVEAHDEKHFVNEFNPFGEQKKDMPAICACLKMKTIKLDAIECIISVGANVNSNALGDSPPLILSCYAKRGDVAKILLDNGASVNNADYSGTFPLFAALNSGCQDIFKMILDRDADVDVSDVNGSRLLHCACKSNALDCIEWLLQRKPNVVAADTNGDTFMHYAARDGNTECLKLVLKYPDSTKVFSRRDTNGLSTKDVAKEKGFLDFVAVMEEADL